MQAAIVLLIAAMLLLSPSLFLGTLLSHSSSQNLTWATQFADQFRAGVLYPRVLPESFDGLGAPTFYFYPPLAAWLDAVLSVVTFNALSVSHRLPLSAVLFLWASGLAMRAWLGEDGPSTRTPLYGALAYMAAPYHLIDHYYRGAEAEFAAYAILPLVMLAIRRTESGRRSGPVLLAVAYGTLPVAHLPTSLLISLTAIPAYVLYRGWKLTAAGTAVRFVGWCAMSVILGLGLAAAYLVPALSLQSWISASLFWSGGYRIENWFLLGSGHRFPLTDPNDMMALIARCAVTCGFAAMAVLALQLRAGGWRSLRSEAAFWALLSLACLLIATGAVPWFWRIPFAAKVQFPWRLMMVVEFATTTALCAAPWPAVRSRTAACLLIASTVALAATFAGIGQGIRLRAQLSSSHREVPADAKEYEPAGYPQSAEGRYADLNLGPVKRLAEVSCLPPGSICRAHDGQFGAVTVELASEVPTTVVVRRFFFPYWQLDPSLPIVATDPLRLVSFRSPAGHHVYRLRRVAVPQEKVGWAISGLSLLLLLAWARLASLRTNR
jgi:hypothetical protein